MDTESVLLWLGVGWRSLNQLHTESFLQGETYSDGQKQGQGSKNASLKDAGVP